MREEKKASPKIYFQVRKKLLLGISSPCCSPWA